MRTLNIILISLFSTISFGLVNLSDSSLVEKEYEKAASERNFYAVTPAPPAFVDHGVITASWYGKKFDGRETANGETYDENALTAAHKSFPFGTILKITNLRNHKYVFVRINDRGPYIEGRSLDLSKGSAKALGILRRGVVNVKVEEVVVPAQNTQIVSLD